MEMSHHGIMPFAFGDHLVRVHRDENGEPWFVAKDVCRILELANVTKAVYGLDDDEKITLTNSEGNPRAGIPHEMNAISESGLYALVFRSRKPEARAFSKWVRAEVLPAIRKTGRYQMPGRAPLRRAPLPDDLPPEALSLRPNMRQRLWRDALESTRLEGGTAREWFAYLCRLVAALPPAPHPAREKVRAFFHQCCRRAEGARIKASDLYAAFRSWHSTQKGDLPSKKVFAVHMQEFARRYRSDGSWFDGICLAREGR